MCYDLFIKKINNPIVELQYADYYRDYKMEEVENTLRYTFKNKSLLAQALLHKSTKEGMTL